MAKYRVTNVTVGNVELHTADATFDVERSEDGEAWNKVEGITIQIKIRWSAEEIAQQIYTRADGIALKDATLTDVFDEVRTILSAKKLEPVTKELMPLEL